MESREELLRQLPRGGTVVEVGVWKGDFAAVIAEILVPERLILIDKWHDYWGLAGDAIYHHCRGRFAAEPNVEMWRGLSHEMIPRLDDQSVDMAYIDADHAYEGCLSDLEDILPKMKSGGWICGHDYCCCENYGVVRAVAVFLDRHKLTLDLLTDEAPQPVLGGPRNFWCKETSYNSYGIRIP